MSVRTSPRGLSAFSIVAIGQAVSLVGTGMTGFATVIWAWQETGSATVLALTGFFAFGPVVLVSPFAGVLVDRWNRKFVMMLSDLAAGLATVVLLVLYTTGQLQIWHLFLINGFEGIFQAFQWPAYSAAISTMVPKKQYGRANGMLELARAASGILAPVLAGALIGFVGIEWIFIIDIITFLFAIGSILIIHIPQPEVSDAGLESRGSIWKEAAYGFKYILTRPSLFWLQMVFFFINLSASFGFTVLAAMILARTNNNAASLGTVQSAGAIGGVVGGVLLTVWGGPRRRIHGVLGGMILFSIFNTLLMGLGRDILVWAAAGFIGAGIIPILNGSNQAIWQAKVAPDLQGRVFSVRRLIAQITAPVAMLLAGPLADYLFEPAMSSDGVLVPVFGDLIGTGPGAGMALMFMISGILGVFIGIGGYMTPIVRNVETILPDHDQGDISEINIQERLEQLLIVRQKLLFETNNPNRDRALKHISRELRELGKITNR